MSASNPYIGHMSLQDEQRLAENASIIAAAIRRASEKLIKRGTIMPPYVPFDQRATVEQVFYHQADQPVQQAWLLCFEGDVVEAPPSDGAPTTLQGRAMANTRRLMSFIDAARSLYLTALLSSTLDGLEVAVSNSRLHPDQSVAFSGYSRRNSDGADWESIVDFVDRVGKALQARCPLVPNEHVVTAGSRRYIRNRQGGLVVLGTEPSRNLCLTAEQPSTERIAAVRALVLDLNDIITGLDAAQREASIALFVQTSEKLRAEFGL